MSEKVFSANEALPEGTTSAYVATFKDPRGRVIPASAVTSVKMTLTAQPEDTIINGRDQHETLDDSAIFVGDEYILTLDADDVVMVGAQTMQARRMVLRVFYTDGEIPHVVTFYVKNQPGVG